MISREVAREIIKRIIDKDSWKLNNNPHGEEYFIDVVDGPCLTVHAKYIIVEIDNPGFETKRWPLSDPLSIEKAREWWEKYA